jgi:hypothetical protein
MVTRFLGVLLVVAVVDASAGIHVERRPDGGCRIDNGALRLEITRGRTGFGESIFVGKKAASPLLSSGSSMREDPAYKSDGKMVRVRMLTCAVTESTDTAVTLRLSGATGMHTVTKTITVKEGSPFVDVVVTCRVDDLAEIAYLLSTYSFLPGIPRVQSEPDFVWTPELRPDPEDVIADEIFRSPALIFQKGNRAAALIPEVRRIQPWRSFETSADLQVPQRVAPFMSYGAMNWRQRSHVFFTHSDKMTTLAYQGQFSYGYTLYCSAAEPEHEAYRTIVRYHWQHNGGLQQAKGPQTEPFASYERKAWELYLPSIATDTVYAQTRVTLLRQERLAWSNRLPLSANNDTWFTVWFNALRTAYGTFRFADLRADSALKARATRVLNLAMLAPANKGLAPSIFYLDSAGGHWVGDQGWGGIKQGRYYSAFNNAWTCYWLLKWMDLVPDRRAEILTRCRAFADFLIAHQEKSGVIPSWYNPETLVPADTFRYENAETAGSALFLASAYAQTHEKRYLEGAERAMAYIFREIVPQRKWFDFETFFSCTRKTPGFFDPYTRQYAQNTLSMDQAAAACAELYRVTGNVSYKERGTSLLDYLLLYQQVWSPPWLSRELFGGFGVQNTDAEWSDSRQGYFAVTLMEYYDLTGEREYLERAVAATRAMYSLFETPQSPRTGENYAHSARDRVGGVTGIHWGTGSSAVAIGLLRERYGDALINVRAGWGVGIDGCRVPRIAASGDSIAVDVLDNIETPRSIEMRFLLPAETQGGSFHLVVNGKRLGAFEADQLRKGIRVTLGEPS